MMWAFMSVIGCTLYTSHLLYQRDWFLLLWTAPLIMTKLFSSLGQFYCPIIIVKIKILYSEIIYNKFILINMIIFYIIYLFLLISTIILKEINKLFKIYHINKSKFTRIFLWYHRNFLILILMKSNISASNCVNKSW